MWKARKILLVVVMMLALSGTIFDLYAGSSPPGPGTANSTGSYRDPNGSLTQIQPLPFKPYNGTDNAQNNTITFDVLGLESQQPSTGIVFTVATTGSLTVKFIGSQPQVICSHCSQSYSGNRQLVTYSGVQSDVLTIIWSASLIKATEPQKVVFIDDFLYSNPLLESSWTIDRYTTNVNSGVSTSSGYVNMAAQSSSTTETVHVTNAVYSNTSYTTGTAVKRKMTVSFIPFTKTEAGTADLRIGMTALLGSGAYPGTGPYGTPFVDINNNCVSNGTDNEQRGMSYFVFKNDGTVVATTCVLSGISGNKLTLETGLNPSLYTVFTVETYGIFCSTCTDNAYIGSSWVYFRAYQRDSSRSIITGTDKNINFTSGIAPLFQTNYAFISQFNSNAAATGQVSRIDLVQVQNYGSPVCLSVPGGSLCTRLPPIPSSFGQGLISDMAWLANMIGFGDEQIGAIILFIVLAGGFSFIPFILTRNYLIGGTGLLLVFSFFIYAGFLPSWMLFLPILFGGVLGVLLVNRLLGSHSLMGGGSDSG